MKLLHLAALSVAVTGQLHPSTPAKYQELPSLRERAQIQDTWRDERVSRIPSLLKKHGVDAWLVSALCNKNHRIQRLLDEPERTC